MAKGKLEHLWAALIAGGWGTRQFPLSNETRPKQFVQLDDFTFIQHTVKRLVKAGVMIKHIVVVVTHAVQRDLAISNLVPLGVLSQNIIIISPDFGFEGAAIQATKFVYQHDEHAFVLSTPSDHAIKNVAGFGEAVRQMYNIAKDKRQMVILGKEITNHGAFVQCGHAIFDDNDDLTYRKVVDFVEKPDAATADQMMRQGNSLCYTGVRIVHAMSFLAEASKANLLDCNVPTDHLMKTIPDIIVCQGDFDWADCGTLDALWSYSKKTPNHHNAVHGEGFDCERLDCRSSFFHSVEGVNLICADVHNQVIAYEIINDIDTDEPHNFLLIAGRKYSHLAKHLAEEFTHSKHLLPRVFTVDTQTGAVIETAFDVEHPHGNRILKSNISNTINYGFIGCQDMDVLVHQRKDGVIDVFITRRQHT